jgi:hypothetical protein
MDYCPVIYKSRVNFITYIMIFLFQFLQQYRHYQAMLQVFRLQPDQNSKELEDLIMFLAQVCTVVDMIRKSWLLKWRSDKMLLFNASLLYNPFRGKQDTVMRGSLRNVVRLTRPYIVPLAALFWAPNTRSVQHDQLCYLSFEKLAYFQQLVRAILYTMW